MLRKCNFQKHFDMFSRVCWSFLSISLFSSSELPTTLGKQDNIPWSYNKIFHNLLVSPFQKQHCQHPCWLLCRPPCLRLLPLVRPLQSVVVFLQDFWMYLLNMHIGWFDIFLSRIFSSWNLHILYCRSDNTVLCNHTWLHDTKEGW